MNFSGVKPKEVEGGGTGLTGTAVDHVQAVLAQGLYALASMFPRPRLSSREVGC